MNDVHELGSIDLNLLVALDALVREGSVTRAAARIGVTQSAMSHTLRRLRTVFDDPLLVRAGGRMVLTPRAEAIAPSLRGGLRTLARVFEPEHFDPATAERTFTVAAPDLFLAAVFAGFFGDLRRRAPGIGVAVRPFAERGHVDALTTGDLDLAILARPQVEAAPGIVARTLFRDTLSCFVGASGPDVATLEAYAAADHAVVSPRSEGGSPVDALLAEHGLSRRIVLRLPDFVGAPMIIAATDLVLTAPTTLARLAGSDVTVHPLPLAVAPHAVACFWHERFSEDPAHRWFREVLMTRATPRGTQPTP